MLEGRAMAVFTIHHFMGRGKNLLFLIGMAVPAVFLPLIFDFKGFPFRYVSLPVPAIHVPPFMDSEVFGNHENPGDQDDRHQSQNHIQGPQDMHGLRPFTRKLKKTIFPLPGENLKGENGYRVRGLAAALPIPLFLALCPIRIWNGGKKEESIFF
jgi:hypothetical protein